LDKTGSSYALHVESTNTDISGLAVTDDFKPLNESQWVVTGCGKVGFVYLGGIYDSINKIIHLCNEKKAAERQREWERKKAEHDRLNGFVKLLNRDRCKLNFF